MAGREWVVALDLNAARAEPGVAMDRSAAMEWLVCDYGDVISAPQQHTAMVELARLCGCDLATFGARYWEIRLSYDRGVIDEAAFFTHVAGRHLTTEEVAELVAVDAASWTVRDRAAEHAIEAAAQRGLRLALLSNAPSPIARLLEADPWFDRFEVKIFSCDVTLTKPDPAIFALLLDRLGAAPGEVAFVDDRVENVAAALALGIDAVTYTPGDPSPIDAVKVS